MAVAPTGAIYKALEFDGVSSRTYGVYITGEAVYNAPERDVEMVTIPGRNGTYALDNGRFENIEVSYPAGIFAETEADFRAAISDFRNFLCSRNGYVRLQDEYNPDEYRMAVYKSGLEVDPAMLKAGEFTITFDCKPQRWLTSGESAVSVTSGNTLTNPTLFEASPLLEVVGYGDIGIGGESVRINNSEIGDTPLRAGTNYVFTRSWHWYPILDTSQLNIGDDIYFPSVSLVLNVTTTSNDTTDPVVSALEDESQTNIETSAESVISSTTGRFLYTLPAKTFTYGTSESAASSSAESMILHRSGATDSVDWSFSLSYNGSTQISINMTISLYTAKLSGEFTCATLMGRSTKSALGNPNYIDLDIGEAWKEEGGTIISINNAVELPAKLPMLDAGSNVITFDNTITDLKVVPRWWKI